jgi:hypothetical protein
MDLTENTVSLLMWVTYHVFHHSGTVSMATLLPAVLLLLHDIIADVDMICSPVVCKLGSGHMTW